MITTMTMTKKERAEKELLSVYANPPAPKTKGTGSMSPADWKKFLKTAKKVKVIFERADKEGIPYGGH